MFKKLTERFFGKKVSPTPGEPSEDPERRTETLAGGFVYEYPYTVNGTTVRANNIIKAAKLFCFARSERQRQEREALYRQVVEREVAQTLEAIQKRVEEQVAEEAQSRKI